MVILLINIQLWLRERPIILVQSPGRMYLGKTTSSYMYINVLPIHQTNVHAKHLKCDIYLGSVSDRSVFLRNIGWFLSIEDMNTMLTVCYWDLAIAYVTLAFMNIHSWNLRAQMVFGRMTCSRVSTPKVHQNSRSFPGFLKVDLKFSRCKNYSYIEHCRSNIIQIRVLFVLML